MIEERLQQIVEAEQNAKEAEMIVLREVAELQALREKAREAADKDVSDEVTAYKDQLESRLKERIETDMASFQKQYDNARSAIQQSARTNQDALTTWMWEEVILQYGSDADAKAPSRHGA